MGRPAGNPGDDGAQADAVAGASSSDNSSSTADAVARRRRIPRELVRLIGDGLVDRFGPQRFIRASGLMTATGVTVAVVGGSIPTAFIGFAMVGMGCASVFPTVMGLAGQVPGWSSSRGVALVSLGSWPAFFAGPPVIGLLAEAFTLRYALILLIAAALTVAFLAGKIGATRPPRRLSEIETSA